MAATLGLILAVEPALIAASDATSSPRGQLHIYLIRDIHRNAVAQKEIASILNKLADDKSIKLVGVEGAFGPFDFNAFRAFPRTNRLVSAEKFLKANRISAPTYVGITREKSAVRTVGVDDQESYGRNVNAYMKAKRQQPNALRKLAIERELLFLNKKATFHGALRRFDDLRERYRAGEISFGEYLKTLARLTKTQSNNLRRFVMASELEEHVKSLLDARRPAQGIYRHYLQIINSVDIEALFMESDTIERTAMNALSKTDEQRALLAQGDRLYLIEKLIRFELTPREWGQYKALRTEPAQFTNFEDFYRFADRRSEQMLENLLRTNTAGNTAALVAGGFHTPHLVKLLRERGIITTVLAPKVSNITEKLSPTAYLSAFDSGATDFNTYFFRGKQYLSDARVAAVGTDFPLAQATTEALLADELGNAEQPHTLAPAVVTPAAAAALFQYPLLFARRVLKAIRYDGKPLLSKRGIDVIAGIVVLAAAGLIEGAINGKLAALAKENNFSTLLTYAAWAALTLLHLGGVFRWSSRKQALVTVSVRPLDSNTWGWRIFYFSYVAALGTFLALQLNNFSATVGVPVALLVWTLINTANIFRISVLNAIAYRSFLPRHYSLMRSRLFWLFFFSSSVISAIPFGLAVVLSNIGVNAGAVIITAAIGHALLDVSSFLFMPEQKGENRAILPEWFRAWVVQVFYPDMTFRLELATNRRDEWLRFATTDPDTGLGNAQAYQTILRKQPFGNDTRVIIYDANNFKRVNNETERGWDEGDLLIKKIGVALRHARHVNPNRPIQPYIFRIGGDEFAIVCHKNDSENILTVTESAFGVHEFHALHSDGQFKEKFYVSISGGIGKTDLEANQSAVQRKAIRKNRMPTEFMSSSNEPRLRKLNADFHKFQTPAAPDDSADHDLRADTPLERLRLAMVKLILPEYHEILRDADGNMKMAMEDELVPGAKGFKALYLKLKKKDDQPCTIIDLINFGLVNKHAPGLQAAGTELIKTFGRSIREAIDEVASEEGLPRESFEFYHTRGSTFFVFGPTAKLERAVVDRTKARLLENGVRMEYNVTVKDPDNPEQTLPKKFRLFVDTYNGRNVKEALRAMREFKRGSQPPGLVDNLPPEVELVPAEEIELILETPLPATETPAPATPYAPTPDLRTVGSAG